MSIRELVQKNNKLVGIGAAALLLLACVLVFLKGGNESADAGTGLAYYSDDDGKTWFTGPADQLAPFEHSGKQAVRALLYTTDGGKTRFVGYLERYSESAKKALLNSRQGNMVPLNELTAAANDVEVKSPGDATWLKRSDPAAKKILEVIVAGSSLPAVPVP